jgi:hypothetical protein
MMDWHFDGSPETVEALGRTVSEIPQIQRTLVEHHAGLQRPDRAAHQQQIAAGKVTFRVATVLPPELDGVGLFRPGSAAIGIGRISTGLGCPHLETDPDFLGLMLSFQTTARERVDFLGINDPTAPTDTVEEFVSLLAATAAAAGTEVPFGAVGQLDLGNLTATQARMFEALRERLGTLRATSIYLHLVHQTTRTARSSSAIQQYWTGVVEAGGTPGKFTFIPTAGVNEHRALRPGQHHLTVDWEARCKADDIGFDVRWIPFANESATPLDKMSASWSEAQSVPVGTVTFPRSDPETSEGRLLALLASEMGANPGHWVGTRAGEPRPEFPATRFTAARQLAYALGQKTRDALPEAAYQEFFDRGGAIGPELERELLRRYEEKREAGHASPGVRSGG